LQAVALPVRRNLAAADLLRESLDEIVEDENNRATVVMDDLLRLGVNLGALRVVRLGTTLENQLVEPVVLPERLVPRCVFRVGLREHPVTGRTAAPVGGAPALLEPDVTPVAVIRLAYDIDLDAALGRVFLYQHG